MAAGFAATMLAGMLPAWIGTRPDPASSLGRAERTSTETRGARTLTRALLVTELALACTLLVGATLLVRSVINLRRPIAAFHEGVLYLDRPAEVFPDAPPPRDRGDARRFVPQLPSSSDRPLVRLPRRRGIHFGDDWLPDGPDARPVSLVASSYGVGGDFFELYGIRLLRGRTFQPGDGPERVIVGERMAARLWPNQDPVGRSFRRGKEHLQVIGLVREINFPSLQPESDRAEFYRVFVPGSSYVYLNVGCQVRCPSKRCKKESWRLSTART